VTTSDDSARCQLCGRPLRWIERHPGNDPVPPTADLPTYADCTFCLEVPDAQGDA
jgi:hypothetical protein